jgi:hypothetical protein
VQVEHLATYNDQAVPLLHHLRSLAPAGLVTPSDEPLAVPLTAFKHGRLEDGGGLGQECSVAAAAHSSEREGAPPSTGPAEGSVAAAVAMGAATGLFQVWQGGGGGKRRRVGEGEQ